MIYYMFVIYNHMFSYDFATVIISIFLFYSIIVFNSNIIIRLIKKHFR